MVISMKIVNALIRKTYLGRTHGNLTFLITLDYGVAQQAFGGYGLGCIDNDGTDNYISFKILDEILSVVGVNSWEELVGQYVRVKKDPKMSTIREIGNIMKDKWFNIDKFYESL